MDRPRMPSRPLPVGVACLVAAGLTACGATSTGTSGPTPSGSAAAGASATPAPVGSTVSEAQNGAIVGASRGQTVTLVLHSTYWKLGGSSDDSVLKLIGGPAVQPSPQGCVPGQGCGTVTAQYGATGDGQATLTASRTICGEALRCTEAQGRFTVTVVVSG